MSGRLRARIMGSGVWQMCSAYFARLGMRNSAIADRAGLLEFVRTRAAHVSQTSLYGYLRTRAGTRYPELFADEKFLESINIAKWHVWLACMSDLWVYAGALLVGEGRAQSSQVTSLVLGGIDEILAETGVPAGHLELELTESVIMGNAAETSATLQALRSIGVRLAIDDFGTGYSSLSYLKRLPINTLKIDKEFVDDLTHDPDDAAITSTIITMAHSLGLNVVAEGVENEAQVEFLIRRGCDEIQGYWFARPMAPEACMAFLRERLVTAELPG